jgi:hypothetical protein
VEPPDNAQELFVRQPVKSIAGDPAAPGSGVSAPISPEYVLKPPVKPFTFGLCGNLMVLRIERGLGSIHTEYYGEPNGKFP